MTLSRKILRIALMFTLLTATTVSVTASAHGFGHHHGGSHLGHHGGWWHHPHHGGMFHHGWHDRFYRDFYWYVRAGLMHGGGDYYTYNNRPCYYGSDGYWMDSYTNDYVYDFYR